MTSAAMNSTAFDGRSHRSRIVFLPRRSSGTGAMRIIATLTGIVFVLALQGSSLAQETPSEPEGAQAHSEQALPDQANQSNQQSVQPLLDEGQLDQLVAPIALYPDPLLAQVLIASTYPLEVVQAERWLEKNKDLKGEALDEALAKEDWDDSIKALVEVPDVLSMMNKDLDWTSKLGDAVLAQQADVMEAVQRLRALAHENGKLESNEQQTVTVKQEVHVNQAPADQEATTGQEPAPQVIVIEPTSPDTVYVPYYQPSVVYGSWPYPDYPPYYFEPRPGYIFGGALATGLAWSAGFAIGNAIWGDGFDWHDNNIRVNVNRNVKINNKNVNVTNWQHNSYHRRGVNYNNTDVRNKFSKADIADKRNNFRGRIDEKPNLGEKRPSVGELEGALKDKKLGGGALANKKPDLAAKKPDLGDKRPGSGLADKKPDLAAKKPDIKQPNIKKPQAKRTPGNAFDKRDGAKAKDFSKRGKASVGNRSATKLATKKPAARPAMKKPSAKKPSHLRGGRPKKHGGGGGRRRR
jgi:hypothetical protein